MKYRMFLDMEQLPDSPQTRSSRSLEGFFPLVIITEVCGIVLLILVGVWNSYYRGGYSWRSDPKYEFNWHPLLMIIGLVYLYSNAMLLYRTQRNVRKQHLKLIHAALMLSIILLVVIALVAVFDSHNLASSPKPNMYTLHSWMGLTTVILFCCQWVAGCVSFFFPGLHSSLRAVYMPLHVFFGIAAFVGAIASCLLGLNEKAIFTLKDKYTEFVNEGMLINFIGVFLIVFGGLSVYLVSQESYRRIPRPEDDMLLSR